MAERKTHAPSLTRALFGFVITTACGAMILIWVLLAGRIDDVEGNLQDTHAVRGAEAFQMVMTTAIEREWRSLTAVAEQIGNAVPSNIRTIVDAVPNAGGRIFWAGMADTSGVIVHGSGRMMEGEDVSTRRWFREGLRGPSVGNVYELDSTEGDDDTSRVNMSLPVYREDGSLRGVMVYTMRMASLEAYANDIAGELDLDVFVLDRSGNIVMEAREVDSAPLDASTIAPALALNLPTLRSSTDRKAGAALAILPDLVQGDMPSFGWKLVVRVPMNVSGGQVVSTLSPLVPVLGTLMLSLLLLVGFYANHFLRPVRQLANVAQALAKGEAIYPTDNHSSRETATLSHSLAIIQSRLDERTRRDAREKKSVEWDVQAPPKRHWAA
ncbi:cache domain-containing protein [Psychromarinibacter sp. S121]|uniref:cache domain-containing protein n=1 Tax=Psychromarinibacter sp. S121 TaxID=3415127 RepID=UPI003C79A38D